MSIVAPHYCCGCGFLGKIICDNCKYNIIDNGTGSCLSCGRTTSQDNLCTDCKLPYSRAWFVGDRTGVLQQLIGLYKFQNTKEAHIHLADLLDMRLPVLPRDSILVPIPTIQKHIRQRGYDHIALIVKQVAKKRSLKYESILQRVTNTQQRNSDHAQRIIQAKQAFSINQKLNPKKTYVIFDDVYTTGSTVKYAAKKLRSAGANRIWVVIIARQTLD